MRRRIVIEVRWSKSERMWYVRRRDISGGVLLYAHTKHEGIKVARAEARAMVSAGGVAEMIVYNKDASIGEGHDSRATYPRKSDPRKSKG